MSERVVTVGGNKATRPITDFMVNVATEYYVGPNATGAGDDGRAGLSKETSLATWAKAITLATASKGDIIYLLPGHTETLATAAAVNLSKIGVRTINLGKGALAATFTFSAVDATITMTAASCSIEGYPIFKPSIDSVVSPLVISAADCKADIIIQDASATVECVRAILTTAAADRLEANIKYRGFIAGDACDNAIRLVGVDTARIKVDFYGVADVGIVEFHTTACHDIDIKGIFYNDGTSLTKNVVDTVGGSAWSVQGWDGNSQSSFSGGDGVALASDDVSALAAQALKLDGVTLATAPVAASLASFIASGGTALGTQLPASFSLLDMIRGKKVSRAAADVFDGSQTALFTIGGGRVLVVGLAGEVSVAAIDGGASNTSFVTNPTVGTDMAMCAVLDINADEEGSIYSITGIVGDALSGGSGGGAMFMDRGIVVPEGTIDLLSAADVGTGGALGAFDIWYLPLDTGATIVAI